MKKIFPVLCKLAAVCLSFILIIQLITPVFIPKFMDTFPTTAVMDGFYALPKNNIDVLFLGSSQIMTAISPMQIYKECGITSYNMGTEQQNLIASYYLLKEAMAYQNPKVVVLDIMFLFPYAQDTPLNSREEFVRKSIDYMKWSPNKWDYINTVCSLDSAHERRSYIVPFLRYHSRWNDLTLHDITYLFEEKSNPLRGFSISERVETEEQFAGFTVTDPSMVTEVLPTMEEYFNKIIALCEENDISLVLLKTPKANGSFGEIHHNTIQNMANKKGLVFLDLNEKTLFDEVDFNVATDYNDGTHINYYGACKISHFLADYLKTNYSLTDYRNTSGYENWEQDLQTYLTLIPR